MCIVSRYGKGLNTKTLLIIANVVHLFIGLLMLVLGIVAKVNPGLILTMLGKMPKAFDLLGGIVTTGAIFMIILGVIVAGVGLFGCCAACSEKGALLIAYIVVLVVVLLTQLALIIFVAVAPEKVKEIIQDRLNKSLNEFKEDATFEDGVLKNPKDTVSLGWTVLQLQAKCCGAYSYKDYSNWPHNVTINGTINGTTNGTTNGTIRSAVVPISCCVKYENVSLASSASYGISNFSNLNACLDGNATYINEKNCYKSVSDIVSQSLMITIGSVAAIIGEQLVMIILAAVMFRQTRVGQQGQPETGTSMIKFFQDGVDWFRKW